MISTTRVAVAGSGALSRVAKDPTMENVAEAVKFTALTGLMGGLSAQRVGQALRDTTLVRNGSFATNALTPIVALAMLPRFVRTIRDAAHATAELASAARKVWDAKDSTERASAWTKVRESAEPLLGSGIHAAYLVADTALTAKILQSSRAAYTTISRAVPHMAKSQLIKNSIKAGLANSRVEAIVRRVAGREAGKVAASLANGPWGTVAKTAFKVIGPIYAVLDAVNVLDAWSETSPDRKKLGLRSLQLVGSVAGATLAFAPALAVTPPGIVIGVGASVLWGGAKLAEYYYQKSKERQAAGPTSTASPIPPSPA